MASDCNFTDLNPILETDKEEEFVEQWSSIDSSHGFDCNICLEFVQDPVVSLCGHLYCWPCIYKWIHLNSASDEDSDHQPRCPVCKAEVSAAALVPIYGRGKEMISRVQRGAPNSDLTMPQRPSSLIFRVMSPTSSSHHQQVSELYDTRNSTYAAPLGLRLAGSNSFQSILEIFGEMVCSRMCGQSVINAHVHSNSYNVAAAGTPRLRRQMMQADQSLGRLCFFCLCCVILCLLLF